jgi:hypothetical protein
LKCNADRIDPAAIVGGEDDRRITEEHQFRHISAPEGLQLKKIAEQPGEGR